MLWHNRVVLMTGLTLGLVAEAAAAQAPDIHAHRGFWIGFGVGGGKNLSQGLDGKRVGGGAGYLRLGGTVSQRVLLGFDGTFWGRDESGNTIARGMEFGVSPMPETRRQMIDRGRLFGVPAYRWLPARTRVEVEYRAFATSL